MRAPGADVHAGAAPDGVLAVARGDAVETQERSRQLLRRAEGELEAAVRVRGQHALDALDHLEARLRLLRLARLRAEAVDE